MQNLQSYGILNFMKFWSFLARKTIKLIFSFCNLACLQISKVKKLECCKISRRKCIFIARKFDRKILLVFIITLMFSIFKNRGLLLYFILLNFTNIVFTTSTILNNIQMMFTNAVQCSAKV